MKPIFRKLSVKVSSVAGSPYAFILSFLVILFWATSGPLFNFSDTWQLVINTGTTIVTFLMVFLIQNTQNRDSKAMHLKLDELIRSHRAARDSFIDLESISDEGLAELDSEFKKFHIKDPNDVVVSIHEKVLKERSKRGHISFADIQNLLRPNKK